MNEDVKFEDFEGNDQLANGTFVEAVYPKMTRLAIRLMANEKTHHTLQPTALANEALIRISNPPRKSFKNHAEFYVIAIVMMRRILYEYASSRRVAKRGHEPISLDRTNLRSDPGTIMQIGEGCICSKGLTNSEISEALGILEPTEKRDWRLAKARLHNS